MDSIQINTKIYNNLIPNVTKMCYGIDAFGVGKQLKKTHISATPFTGAVRVRGYNIKLKKKFVGFVSSSLVTKNQNLIGLYKVVINPSMLNDYSYPANSNNPKIEIYEPYEIPSSL